MGLLPNATRYFAEKHIEAAEKHLAAVQENLFTEGQEDRRAFEKFYNNLALFSGGTIALSVTYLGYLKSLGKPLLHQRVLTASWISLFICLLCSLLYVLVNLYYGHHYREHEYAEAKKKKFETEAEEVPKLGVLNIQTPQQIADFQNPRREAARICAENVERHEKLEKHYLKLWQWAGRIARLGFAGGIGLLMWFAITNVSLPPLLQQKDGINDEHKDPPGQWILESYSVVTGYVFRKDGVRYHAHCRGMLEASTFKKNGLDLSAGLVPIPSGPTQPESNCSAILPYLNKPVPLKQFPGVDAVLQYKHIEEGPYKGNQTEFIITEATGAH